MAPDNTSSSDICSPCCREVEPEDDELFCGVVDVLPVPWLLLDDDCCGGLLLVLPWDVDEDEVLPRDGEDWGEGGDELEVEPELEDDELDDELELELELELEDELLDCSVSGGLQAASPNISIDINAIESILISGMVALPVYSSKV